MNYHIKLKFNQINYLLSICILYIFLLYYFLCQNNEIPQEIKNNYLEISLIPSGNTINKDHLICTYDYNFSNVIATYKNIQNEVKIILCFIKNSKSLFVFKDDINFLYKLDLSSLSASNFSIYPYIDQNSNLFCIISYIITENKLNIDIYKFNLTSNENIFNKVDNLQFFNETIIPNFYNSFGCHISDISNQNLICFFLVNQWIYSLTFDIQNNI